MQSAQKIKFLLLCLMTLVKAHALTCSAGGNTVAFGNYNVLSSTPTDGSATLSVTCNDLISILVDYTITLSTGSSGNYTARTMQNAGRNLQYNLYTDAARTIVWGNGSGGSSSVVDGYLLSVLSITKFYTVYGRVPAQQVVPIGGYSDSIVMTVTY